MKISVSHLRIFGCVAFAHVPKELRKNLDDKNEKCIFVRYTKQSKAYKLYNPITKNVSISRDVKFLQGQSWHDQVDQTIKNQAFPITWKQPIHIYSVELLHMNLLPM